MNLAKSFCLVALPVMLMSLTLTGCWSQYELPDLGFVMGVAIDEEGSDAIRLTVQIYRPTPSGTSRGSSRKGAPYVNIETRDRSVAEAIRDVPIHLGRRAQWSHMRVILVSEQLASRENLGELLDLFYRDHEPRMTASVVITEGQAGEYLSEHPLVEQTTSQQLLRIMQTSYESSGKTVRSSLLFMAEQMQSGNGDTAIPYLYKTNAGSFAAAGVALFKKGRMIGRLPSRYTEGLLMLRGTYRSGMRNVPCPGQPELTDSVEILSYGSRLTVTGASSSPRAVLRGSISLAIGELKCTTIKDKKDERKFVGRLTQLFMDEIQASYGQIREKKVDVIGAGQHVYALHPKLWRKLKPDWEESFGHMPLDVRLKVKLVTSGTVNARPAVNGNGSGTQ